MSKMQDLTRLSLAAAMAGAFSLAVVATTNEAHAAGKEKCYGISKAGENDCANNAGTHSCAGQSKENFSGADWKAVDAGTCEGMHGKLMPFDGMNSMMK
jgi:uncharacterized membrane protein